MTTMFVLVPKTGAGAELVIAKASGIVGRSLVDGEILVDMEGNLYGASNLQHWCQRVYHAAGRAKENYPTVARGRYPESDFVQVGVIDTDEWLLHLSPKKDERDALRAWIGDELDEYPNLIDLRAWDRGVR